MIIKNYCSSLMLTQSKQLGVFMPSQPVQNAYCPDITISGQYAFCHHILIFLSVYMLKLCTILETYLKDESNTNITKSDLKFCPKILIAFKKLKIIWSKISRNNTCSDWAVKWLSLISIKPEQVKYVQKLNIHHIWCTLATPHPSIKKNEWWKNDPYAFRLSQSLLFCLSEDKQYTVSKLEIFYVIYFLGTCPTQTTTVLIYIYIFVCTWF